MNKLILTGNIGNDAEVRQMDSGDSVINFSVATTKKDKDNNNVTTWINCTKWVKKDASIKIADYLRKGQTVLVEGEASTRSWIKDNKAYSSLECRVINIELLGKKESSEPQNNSNEEQDLGLPF